MRNRIAWPVCFCIRRRRTSKKVAKNCKLADKLVSMDKAGASNEELAQTMGGLRGLRIGMLEGNTDEGYIALGTGIGNIRSIKSVAEVVNELAIC